MNVGIRAMACELPSEARSLADICTDEGVDLSDADRTRLGIDQVGVAASADDLALTAARNALERAAVTAKEVDVIVDYTVLPQRFLVPVWNLGNKLQHELGATNAFTLGFSGGGATNFHVALRFATDLIRNDDGVGTALLFGAEAAIPGNRVINPDEPVTVLGDGASALVLAGDGTDDVVLATELVSDAAFHDICHIPGGALAQLDNEDRSDLYRLRIDTARLDAARMGATLKDLGERALHRAGVGLGDVAHFIFPNLSAEDTAACRAVWNASPDPSADDNRRRNGHVQGTDLAHNLSSLPAERGDVVVLASHGLGFTAGVTVVRR